MPDLTKEIKKVNDAVIDAWGKGFEQGLKEGKEIKLKERKE